MLLPPAATHHTAAFTRPGAIQTAPFNERRPIASLGDKVSRHQAVATMPIWWDAMPQQLHNNIDFRIQAWQRDHPRTNTTTAQSRRLDLLLAKAMIKRSYETY